MNPADTLPLPPDELIDRVVSGFKNEQAEEHRGMFLDSGKRSLEDLEAALRAVGSSLERHAKVLEFGCGCGRIMRWMEPYGQRVELHGTDIDRRAIEWAASNLPFARWGVNDGLPPTSYEDGAFDLILNHSVFTHLDETYQDAWLSELQRIAAPDALLVLSVHGQHAYEVSEQQLEAGSRYRREWRETLERDGILFVADDGYVGSAFPDFYHTAFHAPWYLHEHWGKWFDLLAYLPRSSLDFQDQLVLRRRRADEPEPAIVRARPAEGNGPEEAHGTDRFVVTIDEPRSPSRFGVPGMLARRALFRFARPVIRAQEEVNRSLARVADSGGEERMPPLAALALRQQAERLERLELELDELRGPDRE